MSKLRALLIEIEDAGDSAIRAALASLNGQLLEPATTVPALFEPHPRDCRCGMCNLSEAPAPRIAKSNGAVHKRRDSVPAQLPPPSVDGTSSIRDRVLAMLAKRPRSSAELIEDLKCPPQSIYTACSTLKTEGRIVTRADDDHDGVRRWVLKS